MRGPRCGGGVTASRSARGSESHDGGSQPPQRLAAQQATAACRAAGVDKNDAVLLLHGWPQTSYAWWRVAPLFAAAGFRITAPDLRGFGHSGKPDTDYNRKTLAGDLLRLPGVLAIGRC